MSFFQRAPELGNQFDDDRLLQEYLQRVLPPGSIAAQREELRHLGELAGGVLYRGMLEDRLNEPQLTQWGPWGDRVDEITLTPHWGRARQLAAQHGLVATGYEDRFGDKSRVVQFAMNYLVQASLDIYSCPLAMTDGAARTLLDGENSRIRDRALPHLLSRDSESLWTSGQWMTERAGGSDVSKTETIARPEEAGQAHRLYGTKWFTSATTSEMALTLARPEGNPEGSRGLALFYVETRTADGSLNGIRINRLKDKLGTRKVPTAELTLDGALAVPVNGLQNGVKHISSMLNVTRVWNSVAAAWMTRRCVALMRDYAKKRVAFGDTLDHKPLHLETFADLAAETEGLFHLAFRAVELLGAVENGADPDSVGLARVLTPIAKLTTAKQAVHITSETLEAFGGAGYVEDTGLPTLLRDAQVLPIWEGTTNVLSLDTLRALASDGGRELLRAELDRQLAKVPVEEPWRTSALTCGHAFQAAEQWLERAARDPDEAEAGARRFALTVGRSLELAYLLAHAAEIPGSKRAQAAAHRFARTPINLIREHSPLEEGRILIA